MLNIGQFNSLTVTKTLPTGAVLDGGKFGKTESGNIWLDPSKTSPYEFYQFWLNASDEDATIYIRLFTFLPKNQIESLEAEHHLAPHLRVLQEKLAQEMTIMVHGQEDYDTAVAASKILFGKSTEEDLKKLSEKQFLTIFEGVQQAKISFNEINHGLGIIV